MSPIQRNGSSHRKLCSRNSLPALSLLLPNFNILTCIIFLYIIWETQKSNILICLHCLWNHLGFVCNILICFIVCIHFQWAKLSLWALSREYSYFGIHYNRGNALKQYQNYAHSLFHNLQIIFTLIITESIKQDFQISSAQSPEQSQHAACQSWGTVCGIRCVYRVYGIICVPWLHWFNLNSK